MESLEDDSALNIDSLMECDDDLDTDNEYNIEPIPLYFLSNAAIEFGFFEQSTNSFYSIEKIAKANFRIKQSSKIFEVTFKSENTLQRYFYHLTNNFPTLIKIDKNNDDVFLHFNKPPKFSQEREFEEPSNYLMKYFNEENNLLCLDSPYRTILIPGCPKKVLSQIYSQIFYIERREVLIEQYKYLNLDNYLENVRNLKEKINKISENNFYDIYINYANISETLQRRKFESILSIYENFKSDFKIKKYPSDKKQDKNMNDFYVMKHISITPYSIRIKKESFHQSSRFLRLYFHNDNFIKVEFKDENDTQLYSNGHYAHCPKKLANQITGLSKLYYKFFKEGFNLCGKRYIFLLNPTNCMRANSLWLLEENEYNTKKDFYYKDLGLDSLVINNKIPFSKLLSRLSQNFTSSYGFKNKLNEEGFKCEIIDDIKNSKGDLYNDGCGMISYPLMKEICDDMNKGEFASAIQIRYKGAKGVLVVNPKIEGKKIILTKSMVKFKCENTEDLEVIRFSKYSPGYLNLQIIILLILNGISKGRIFDIAKKEVSNYRNYKMVKDNLPIKNIEFDKVLKNIQKNNLILEQQKDYMSKIARSTYIYNRLSNISKKYRFHMKNCCFLIGVCDFDNILEENEIFVQICQEKKKKIITGDILVTKNPCLSVYDLQKVKGVKNSFFSEYFTNVIVFPSKGKVPLPSKITGSDLDGDIYWVCWEKSFLKEFIYKDYSNKVLVLKNKQEYPTKFEDKYTFNEKGERIKKYFIRVKTKDFNKTEGAKNPNLSFLEKCLNYHIFFHKYYKLPEINKNYLAYVSSLFTRDAYKEEVDVTKLEEYAFYHGVEVDFQKAGETSDFIGNLKQPSFLMKRIQQRNSNILIKIKEIYDQYKKMMNTKKEKEKEENLLIINRDENINFHHNSEYNLNNNDDSNSTYSGSHHHNNNSNSINSYTNDENNNSFYEYFIKIGNNQINEFNHKYLKLYEKKRLVNDMYENSFIYKIYELVSVFPPMQEAFLNSLHLISEEYFYEQNLEKNIFVFSDSIFNSFENDIQIIVTKIVEINNYYENEIKYIMSENEISIELELIYLTDFIEPKISVFKNDTEDYKLNLNEQIKFAMKNSINKLESIREEYKMTKNDIINILFIIIFWVPGYDVCISDTNIKINGDKTIDTKEENSNNIKYINLSEQIRRKYRIKSKKEFIDDIVTKRGLDQIKSYYYENLKCFSLYNFYIDFSCGKN